MSNPFEVLENRLSNIENMLLKLQGAQPTDAPTSPQYEYGLKGLQNIVGCSLPTAQKIKNSGRIRYKQSGRKLIFCTAEVLQDLAKGKGGVK